MSSFNPLNTNTVLRDPNHPIPTYLGSNSPRHNKVEYCHGKGIAISERGRYEPRPRPDSMSMEYRGPAFYVPSERNWVKVTEKRDLPPLWKPDIIEMQDEQTWVEFQRERDRPRWNLGLFNQPEYIPFGLPVNTIERLRNPDSFRRSWDHAGTFSPSRNKWLREHEFSGPGLPRDSIGFYNEEDWMKYKYYTHRPYLNTEITK